MKKEITQSDIDEINILLVDKIKTQLKKELSPSEFSSVARIALTFQNKNTVNVINKELQEEEKKAFDKAMKILDGVEAEKVKNIK